MSEPSLTKMIQLYNTLLSSYGPQGWWPINGKYHPKQFTIPQNSKEKFEIIVGTILTQNTAWTNVEKALQELRKKNLLSPKKILAAELPLLAQSIRSAGYFNQKAERLKMIAQWYLNNKEFEKLHLLDQRKELLSLKGVGPETADSILLYAYKKPIFVIDAYTKRIISRLGMLSKDASYDHFQTFFHQQLLPDVVLFNEFHALLVEHAKRYCKTKPDCEQCPLRKNCNFFKSTNI